MTGYRTGDFPDGGVLVDDLLETKEIATPRVTIEGPRRRLAVMIKMAVGTLETGGWASR